MQHDKKGSLDPHALPANIVKDLLKPFEQEVAAMNELLKVNQEGKEMVAMPFTTPKGTFVGLFTTAMTATGFQPVLLGVLTSPTLLGNIEMGDQPFEDEHHVILEQNGMAKSGCRNCKLSEMVDGAHLRETLKATSKALSDDAKNDSQTSRGTTTAASPVTKTSETIH